MKFKKIVKTSTYSFHLEKMKKFYVDKLGLKLISELNRKVGMFFLCRV